MRLGTACWQEGRTGRRALVAPLPSDPARLVDLNRMEQVRLAKLGEGRPEALAAELVPDDLCRLLEAGPRALNRLRQVLAYAEKWQRRSGLPEALAPAAAAVTLLPCLPRPAALRRWDGAELDPGAVRGPGAVLDRPPTPTLAWVGLRPEVPAGCCLALEAGPAVVLGAWLDLQPDWDGQLELSLGGRRRRVPMDTWRDLLPQRLGPGEVLLAPPPRLRQVPAASGAPVRLRAPWENLELVLGEQPLHPTLQ